MVRVRRCDPALPRRLAKRSRSQWWVRRARMSARSAHKKRRWRAFLTRHDKSSGRDDHNMGRDAPSLPRLAAHSPILARKPKHHRQPDRSSPEKLQTTSHTVASPTGDGTMTSVRRCSTSMPCHKAVPRAPVGCLCPRGTQRVDLNQARGSQRAKRVLRKCPPPAKPFSPPCTRG